MYKEVKSRDNIEYFETTLNSRDDYWKLYNYTEDTTCEGYIVNYPCKVLVSRQRVHGFISDYHNYWENDWIEQHIIIIG